jgi:hypothetical protein
MSDFTFKKGTFVQLKANSTIHLGRLERNIYEGDIVEFDGFSLKFNGQQTDMPELKAGLKRGWLALVGEGASEPVAEVAPAPVASAKKEMPVQTVYDEERAVAEVNPQQEEAPKKFPLVVESQDDDIRPVAKVENKSGADIAGASSAGDGIAESQGAQSVSTIKLKTAANTKTVISDGSQASAEISKLDNMEASVTKKASMEVVAVEDQDDFDDLFEGVEIVEEEEESTPSEDQALENAQILQAIDGDIEPSQGAVAVGKDTSKIKVLPGGVEWDTSSHWSKRAKIALEMYGDNQVILDAIMAVESKGVVTAIQKGLAEG